MASNGFADRFAIGLQWVPVGLQWVSSGFDGHEYLTRNNRPEMRLIRLMYAIIAHCSVI